MSAKTQRLDFLAAISGVMIAIQARANGELAHLTGNSIEAALVSFGSALLFVSLIALFSSKVRDGARKLRIAVKRKDIPLWNLFAGMLGGSYVAIQTHIVPLIGVAIYSVAFIAGQTTISLFIDRVGLTGGGKRPISFRRISSAFFTVFAVLIAVFDRIDARNVSVFAVILGCLAGAIVGVQRALNGQINEYTEQSFTTSFLNMFLGTIFLILVLFFSLGVEKSEFAPLPSGPWWIYTGGAIGVIYIAFASTVVQHLGVLTFTLYSVGGQLVGSLLIDLYSPSQGVQVSAYLVTGIAMTYIGVIVGGANNSQFQRRLMQK